MMTEGTLPRAVQAVIEAFSARPEVATIALAGTRSAAHADHWSDYDVYVYADAEVPLSLRRELAEAFDPAPELGNAWFGPGDEWIDTATGTRLDIMYWNRATFERDLRSVIEDHRPSLGYTTAF